MRNRGLLIAVTAASFVTGVCTGESHRLSRLLSVQFYSFCDTFRLTESRDQRFFWIPEISSPRGNYYFDPIETKFRFQRSADFTVRIQVAILADAYPGHRNFSAGG